MSTDSNPNNSYSHHRSAITGFWLKLLVVLFFICFAQITLAAAERRPLVVVSTAELKTIIEQVPLTGTVSSVRVAQLSAEVSGLVESIYVEVGDRVEKGKILMRLDREIAQFTLQSLQAEVNNTVENGWSRNALGIQLENQLFERQAEAEKIENFSKNLPAQSSDLARQTMKDPYVFDFLSLGEYAQEREIEEALVERITKFMLELGKGFVFVGRQYHLEVGGEDFYVDLLFYHLKLHCYVVIELKSGPFKPEYAGKLNFYLTALDEEVKTAEDSSSIGLILCKDRNRIVAEYALRDLNKPIGVSRYELAESLPEELKTSLPTVEEMETELKESGGPKED